MGTTHEDEPLLYIEQPNMRKPERPMQRYFHSNSKQVHGKQEKKGNKRFNDLDLEEKVHYILQVPSQLPALKCEVKTEHGSHRGIIKYATDDKLTMQLFNKKEVTIEKHLLKSIQLISF